DGTGYGTDGTIWGGEFLVSTRSDFTRHAHLHPFRLPGGEAAVREPARSALGVLHESGLPLSLVPGIADSDREVLRQMLDKSVNCPVTTSAGRLFDAVAALLGIHEPQSFEGAAAMRLEGMIEAHDLRLASGPDPLDWRVAVEDLVERQRGGCSRGWLAAAFHNTLACMIVETARLCGLRRVLLTGGCFQNACLTERTIDGLQDAGLDWYVHRHVPPNDGGLALGQAAIAAARCRRNATCA
ncbi:MAG: carbamoyltransferase HypF, partial [Gemmatimonadetes bacterium]|nr:carbamoyltransferase HypF [Gemmatimonadota bacterium]